MTTSNSFEFSLPERGLGSPWCVEIIAPNEAGVEHYLQQYKPFRLLALRESPSSFSSTYARESAFADADWVRRATKPLATTFVATQGENRKILSSATLLGPLPTPGDLVLTGRSVEDMNRTRHLHWQANAVYTLPEARRNGVALAVMSAASEWAHETAASQGQDCVLTALVLDANPAARYLYEKCGFSVSNFREGEVLMVRYLPVSQFTPKSGDPMQKMPR